MSLAIKFIIASYSWTQVSGPNTASFSSKTIPSPTLSGVVQGIYVFALVLTDNAGASGSADALGIVLNAAPVTPVTYRVNAGGPQVTNSIGRFAADKNAFFRKLRYETKLNPDEDNRRA